MDEVFGKVGGRYRISLTDSFMMWVLHCAMDKAHERVQSKEGPLARLNEISKFYELAVMQLEGCLKFVQEETDSSLESSDEEVMGELAEIRDRLEGRLKESELAISDKDRELTERLENELKLRQALELKEKELDSLRANLKLERTKSEGVEELILGNRTCVDEERDEEFSELKHSVDQQVWNIKQKLDPDNKLTDKRRNKSFNDMKIEQMGSDIDVLKETLDLAFEKMRSAILLSELEPMAQQWRWTIENNVIAILIEGFVADIQETFTLEVRSREKQVSVGLTQLLSDMMKEIRTLLDELEPLGTSKSNQDNMVSSKTKGRSSSGGDSVGEVDQTKKDGEEEECGNFVAKMIKNHESIIRRKSEQKNWLKREILKENGSSKSRSEKEPVCPRRRILDVIIKLENLINWNEQLSESLADSEEISPSDSVMTEQVKSSVDTLEDIWNKVNEISISHSVNRHLHDEIRMLKQEKEDASCQAVILESVYLTFLESFMYESCSELYGYELELLIREGMRDDFLEEVVNEWKQKMETERIKVQVREETCYTVNSIVMKELGSIVSSALTQCQDAVAENKCLKGSDLESQLREEIVRVFFGEMGREWSRVIESYEAECLVMEGVNRIAVAETFRGIEDTVNRTLSMYKQAVKSENSRRRLQSGYESCQCAEYSLKEDVCMVFLGEMLKEWKKEIDIHNFESLIKEEVYRLVMNDALTEASNIFGETKFQDHAMVSGNFVPAKKLHRSAETGEEETSIRKENPVPQCNEVKEDLVQGGSSETKEHYVQISLLGLKHKALRKLKTSRELVSDVTSNSMSLSSNIEQALKQISVSKALLNELRSSFGVTDGDVGRIDDNMTPTVHGLRNKTPSLSQPEATEEVKKAPSDSAFSPVMGFSQVLLDFKCRVEKKLRLNNLRLEEAMCDVNQLAEVAAALRRKEWLFREAFKRRCQDLRKAEIEVDLLGDQVDELVGLLEKLYETLHQYLPALEQHFEASDILKMIQKEIAGVLASSSRRARRRILAVTPEHPHPAEHTNNEGATADVKIDEKAGIIN